jgi:hypothetical protein
VPPFPHLLLLFPLLLWLWISPDYVIPVWCFRYKFGFYFCPCSFDVYIFFLVIFGLSTGSCFHLLHFLGLFLADWCVCVSWNRLSKAHVLVCGVNGTTIEVGKSILSLMVSYWLTHWN